MFQESNCKEYYNLTEFLVNCWFTNSQGDGLQLLMKATTSQEIETQNDLVTQVPPSVNVQVPLNDLPFEGYGAEVIFPQLLKLKR